MHGYNYSTFAVLSAWFQSMNRTCCRFKSLARIHHASKVDLTRCTRSPYCPFLLGEVPFLFLNCHPISGRTILDAFHNPYWRAPFHTKKVATGKGLQLAQGIKRKSGTHRYVRIYIYIYVEVTPFVFLFPFFPTAESFGVSAQIGSRVVRGSPEVRFHRGSTRVARRFHEVLRWLRGGASTKKSTACCWGYRLSFLSGGGGGMTHSCLKFKGSEGDSRYRGGPLRVAMVLLWLVYLQYAKQFQGTGVPIQKYLFPA